MDVTAAFYNKIPYAFIMTPYQPDQRNDSFWGFSNTVFTQEKKQTFSIWLNNAANKHYYYQYYYHDIQQESQYININKCLQVWANFGKLKNPLGVDDFIHKQKINKIFNDTCENSISR